MKGLAILLLGGLAWSGPALAAKYPLPGTEADPVYWEHIPTGDDVARAYPVDQVDGRAVVRCRIDDQGLLTDCAVIQETPAGHGFGDAALKLSQKFKAETKTASGKSSSGIMVDVPIRLQVR